jgi:hypothetical protein
MPHATTVMVLLFDPSAEKLLGDTLSMPARLSVFTATLF